MNTPNNTIPPAAHHDASPPTAVTHTDAAQQSTPRAMKFHAAIHPLPRLKICAALESARAEQFQREMKYQALAAATELSTSALSKHLTALEELGYITRVREYGSRRDKDTVWVSITPTGLKAFHEHLAYLHGLSGS